MMRSAKRAPSNARAIKAQLIQKVALLKSRVAELERTNTDLQLSNKALNDNQDHLASLVEHMPAVAFVRDLEGNFVIVNRRYENTYAVSSEAIRGKTLADVFKLDDVFDRPNRARRLGAQRRNSRERSKTAKASKPSAGRILQMGHYQQPLVQDPSRRLGRKVQIAAFGPREVTDTPVQDGRWLNTVLCESLKNTQGHVRLQVQFILGIQNVSLEPQS